MSKSEAQPNHIFRYRDFPISSPTPGLLIRRPILSVTLVNGDKRICCEAIVDTGADHCSFPLTLVKKLGLDPTACEAGAVVGLGNKRKNAFFWPIKIEVAEAAITLDVWAAFTSGLKDQGLLGYTGFFDRATVAFDGRRGIFAFQISNAE